MVLTDLADFDEGPLKSSATQVIGSAPPFNICGRAWWLQNELLKQTPTDDTCEEVSRGDLEAITALDFSTLKADAQRDHSLHLNTSHISEGDFEGLSGLRTLNLSNLHLGAIHYKTVRTCPLPPVGQEYCANISSRIYGPLFAGITSLETLRLRNNRFWGPLPDDAFKDLGSLRELDLRGYATYSAWATHRYDRYNPLVGTPNAFAPLASLVTYNWDKDAPYATNNYPPAPRQNAPGSDAALTAKFQDNPEGHNGADAFTLRISFSKEVDISVEDMRDHALITSGATIDSVGKVDDRSDLWDVTLQPSGDDPVALVIAPTTDCAADGAICTSDGRPLSDGLAVVIPKSEPVQNSPATGLPIISGTARAGETLTVSVSEISDEDGMLKASFGYWWFRVDGGDEILIEDDDGARYTLTGDDVGKTIRVRVKFTDDASNVETLDSEPTATVEPRLLTASFHDKPSSHDGQNAFTFELRFSEEVELSYLTLRDHALTVTGGEVTGASRLGAPSNIRWQVTVEPDSDDGVTVVLPATTDCSAQGAVCTGGGKKLSAGVELTVPGPAQQPQNREATGAPTISGTFRVGETLAAATSGIGDADGLDNVSFSYQWMRSDGNAHTDIAGETGRTYELSGGDVGKTIKVRVSFDDDAGNRETLTSAATETVAPRPPLTASFQGQPSSHDGQADFTFELRFSEELPVSYLTLRDHSFEVTGGTVVAAQRLTQGSNIGWRITVTPDSDADVTVVLPVTTDCDAQGAVCATDGRKLSPERVHGLRTASIDHGDTAPAGDV